MCQEIGEGFVNKNKKPGFRCLVTKIMLLKEFKDQLLSLDGVEKAAVIQILTHGLNQQGRSITKTPGVCGGHACFSGTRMPIWVLVNARRLGISEADLLLDYPTLTAVDLVNAWAYAEAYADEIEAAIRENEVD